MKKPLLLFVLASLPIACGGAAADETPSVDPAMAAAGKQLFKQLGCSACHGESGTGDGLAAAALDPKPRNYADKTWQASVTDAQIKKAILGGGGAVGLSVTMPAHPHLEPEPAKVDNLVAFIRSLGQ